jgi:hypothetical protein
MNCIMPPSGFAQTLTAPALLSEPGTRIGLSETFTPAYLWGMTISPKDPFSMDFIIHRGDIALNEEEKTAEYRQLVKYFLAALAVPDTDQWVNLSPYENNRIIEENFGLTEMGRDLLAQDYMLKQLTASLMYPETDLGKKFWERVYDKAYAQFGSTDIAVNTFNKVWIVPDDAEVVEKGNSVMLVNMHLKVMLEQDYLSLANNALSSRLGTDELTPQEVTAASKLSAEVVKDIILPEIEKEVNTGKNFANLRQIASSMILATWYKKALKDSVLGKVYADQAKVQGIDQDPANNEQIFKQYVEAFKKGAFNFIREDYDRYSEEMIPRKYFSGGFVRSRSDQAMRSVSLAPERVQALAQEASAQADRAQVVLREAAESDRARGVNSDLVKEIGEKIRTDLQNGGTAVDVFTSLVLLLEMGTISSKAEIAAVLRVLAPHFKTLEVIPSANDLGADFTAVTWKRAVFKGDENNKVRQGLSADLFQAYRVVATNGEPLKVSGTNVTIPENLYFVFDRDNDPAQGVLREAVESDRAQVALRDAGDRAMMPRGDVWEKGPEILRDALRKDGAVGLAREVAALFPLMKRSSSRDEVLAGQDVVRIIDAETGEMIQRNPKLFQEGDFFHLVPPALPSIQEGSRGRMYLFVREGFVQRAVSQLAVSDNTTIDKFLYELTGLGIGTSRIPSVEDMEENGEVFFSSGREEQWITAGSARDSYSQAVSAGDLLAYELVSRSRSADALLPSRHKIYVLVPRDFAQSARSDQAMQSRSGQEHDRLVRAATHGLQGVAQETGLGSLQWVRSWDQVPSGASIVTPGSDQVFTKSALTADFIGGKRIFYNLGGSGSVVLAVSPGDFRNAVGSIAETAQTFDGFSRTVSGVLGANVTRFESWPNLPAEDRDKPVVLYINEKGGQEWISLNDVNRRSLWSGNFGQASFRKVEIRSDSPFNVRQIKDSWPGYVLVHQDIDNAQSDTADLVDRTLRVLAGRNRQAGQRVFDVTDFPRVRQALMARPATFMNLLGVNEFEQAVRAGRQVTVTTPIALQVKDQLGSVGLTGDKFDALVRAAFTAKNAQSRQSDSREIFRGRPLYQVRAGLAEQGLTLKVQAALPKSGRIIMEDGREEDVAKVNFKDKWIGSGGAGVLQKIEKADAGARLSLQAEAQAGKYLFVPNGLVADVQEALAVNPVAPVDRVRGELNELDGNNTVKAVRPTDAVWAEAIKAKNVVLVDRDTGRTIPAGTPIRRADVNYVFRMDPGPAADAVVKRSLDPKQPGGKAIFVIDFRNRPAFLRSSDQAQTADELKADIKERMRRQGVSESEMDEALNPDAMALLLAISEDKQQGLRALLQGTFDPDALPQYGSLAEMRGFGSPERRDAIVKAALLSGLSSREQVSRARPSAGDAQFRDYAQAVVMGQAERRADSLAGNPMRDDAMAVPELNTLVLMGASGVVGAAVALWVRGHKERVAQARMESALYTKDFRTRKRDMLWLAKHYDHPGVRQFFQELSLDKLTYEPVDPGIVELDTETLDALKATNDRTVLTGLMHLQKTPIRYSFLPWLINNWRSMSTQASEAEAPAFNPSSGVFLRYELIEAIGADLNKEDLPVAQRRQALSMLQRIAKLSDLKTNERALLDNYLGPQEQRAGDAAMSDSLLLGIHAVGAGLMAANLLFLNRHLRKRAEQRQKDALEMLGSGRGVLAALGAGQPSQARAPVTDNQIQATIGAFVNHQGDIRREAEEWLGRYAYDARVPRAIRDRLAEIDRAMSRSRDLKGGIDLNAANLNLRVRRDGSGMPLPVAQQDLESLKINGLVPEILSIQPVMTLPILGEADTGAFVASTV